MIQDTYIRKFEVQTVHNQMHKWGHKEGCTRKSKSDTGREGEHSRYNVLQDIHIRKYQV